MKAIMSAVVVAAIATPALAQINWDLARTPDFVGSALAAQRAGQQAAIERQQHEAAMQQQAAQVAALQQIERRQAEQEARQRANDFARTDALMYAIQGKCSDALTAAVKTGEPEFVRETAALCADMAPKP